MMKRLGLKILVLAVLLLAGSLASADKINFPDIPGYKTLKCDFHMHTVFSDGAVWPTVRVDEAVREGLDAISITDHIEYQPKKADIPTNHNRPYEIAKEPAAKAGLLLIKGAEITRDTPPGHFNAIFLNDCALLDTKEFLDAVKAANDQGAFVFWNHPDWKPDKKGWFEVHDTLYNNKWFQGIEVCNGGGYHLNGHIWGLEKNLTFMANSDMHAPFLIKKTTPEEHRTLTLVFAKEKSADAIKEALFAGRTAVWFKNQLIAKPDYADALFKAAVRVESAERRGQMVRVEIANKCDLNIDLARTGDLGPEKLILPAMDTIVIRVRPAGGADKVELTYNAVNILIGPEKPLPIRLTAAVE